MILMSKLGVCLTIVIVGILCVAASLPHLASLITFHRRQRDLEVYYTAADMVRTQMGQYILRWSGHRN